MAKQVYIQDINPNLHPFDAWEFDDPARDSTPTLQLKSPWIFGGARTTYSTGWINRTDWTNVHLGGVEITYDNLVGTFTVGETITEATSGNTGVIVSDSGTVLILSDVTNPGVFTDDREITGGTSGATADVDGDTIDTDTNITHGLNRNLNKLDVQVYISHIGAWSDAHHVGYMADSAGVNTYGLSYMQASVNEVIVHTGTTGVGIITEDGTIDIHGAASDEYYYVEVTAID